MTKEIENAYRQWRRTSRVIASVAETPPKRRSARSVGRSMLAAAQYKRSPEAREHMRQAQLRRWAKIKRT